MSDPNETKKRVYKKAADPAKGFETSVRTHHGYQNGKTPGTSTSDQGAAEDIKKRQEYIRDRLVDESDTLDISANLVETLSGALYAVCNQLVAAAASIKKGACLNGTTMDLAVAKSAIQAMYAAKGLSTPGEFADNAFRDIVADWTPEFEAIDQAKTHRALSTMRHPIAIYIKPVNTLIKAFMSGVHTGKKTFRVSREFKLYLATFVFIVAQTLLDGGRALCAKGGKKTLTYSHVKAVLRGDVAKNIPVNFSGVTTFDAEVQNMIQKGNEHSDAHRRLLRLTKKKRARDPTDNDEKAEPKKSKKEKVVA